MTTCGYSCCTANNDDLMRQLTPEGGTVASGAL